MANPEHLKIIEQGVAAWNKFRRENPSVAIDLRKAFLNEVNLEGVNLLGANLSDADLRGANLKNAYLSWANLERVLIWRANLEGATLFGANLKDADLRWTNIKNTNLSEANFDNAIVSGVKFNRRAKYIGIKVATCYGNPRFKRFAQDQEFIEEFKESWLRKPIYWIWLIFADCGRTIYQWMGWCVVFAFFFAWKYYSLGEAAFKIDNLPWEFNSLLYYSVVTFTTLGFGDITPTTTEAAWWVMAEVILGYIMLGGLISIFATKLARRS